MTGTTAGTNMTHFSYTYVDMQQDATTYLPLVIRCFKEKCIYYRYGVCLDFLVSPVWNKIVNTTEEREYTRAVESDLPVALLRVEVEGLFALNVKLRQSWS